jgi:hypothetical protein
MSVETVLDEIAKLKQLRALGLPEALFRDVPGKLVTHYRQRAASEKPRELRRHSPRMRYTLLAALCWQRQREITDNLVELLIHIAHRVGVRAQEKVDVELAKYAKKIIGKAKLLYKLAKAATGQPDGVVRDVIYPVVGEKTLEDLICEAEAADKHEHKVKFVTRGSYGHHYRRIVPALSKALSFQSHNDLHRPVMDALALLDSLFYCLSDYLDGGGNWGGNLLRSLRRDADCDGSTSRRKFSNVRRHYSARPVRPMGASLA